MIRVRPISLDCVLPLSNLSYRYYLICCSSTSLDVLEIMKDSLMAQ